MNGRPDGHNDEPEPQENVDFLVDDVHGQNAQSIAEFDRSRRTIQVERALSDLKYKTQLKGDSNNAIHRRLILRIDSPWERLGSWGRFWFQKAAHSRKAPRIHKW